MSNDKNMQHYKDEEEWTVIMPLLRYLHITKDEVTKDEQPDFKFIYNEHRIGLELVSCCPSSKYDSKGRSLAAINQRKRQKAIEKYKNILIERQENIVIEIKFNHNAFWSAEPENVFIKHVIDEIEELREKQIEQFLKYEKIISRGTYIESMILLPINIGKPFVINNSGQVLQKISQEDFDQCVKNKYQKLYKYKQLEKNSDIDDYWLAIAENKKEFFEFWEVPYDTSKNTGYKRIFLIGYEGVCELPIFNKIE